MVGSDDPGAWWSRRRALRAFGSLAVCSGPMLLGCRGKSPRPRAQSVVDGSSHAKVLRRIEARGAIDGDGATVQRVFPSPALRNLDPFVLLDDFDVRVPAGFPEHPHRGFEAFTYMLEGAFHHRDNLGSDSTIAAGGTQRFNSGAGARHSEMPGTSGTNRGLQLWVNLPRRLKGMTPEYQGVSDDAMPVEESRGLRTHTVVGSASPVELHTQVDYLDITLLADAKWHHQIPTGRNTLLYVLDGSVTLGADPNNVPRGHALLLSEGELEVRGRRGARFAFLSGRPHGEPILHRGPFVD